jgi:hypothetical protein
MVKQIHLKDIEDVQRLNDMACEQPFKITVSCGHLVLDAKSILALFALIGKKDIYLVAPDHIKADKFMDMIKKFSF